MKKQNMEQGKMTKEHFNAGSPYSCWLKEEVIGEVVNPLSGIKNRGLAKKFKIHVDEKNDDEIVEKIMATGKLDDYPDDWKKVAVEIIRMELDDTFKL